MHSASTAYNNITSGLYTVKTVVNIQTINNGSTEYVMLNDDKLYSVKTSGSLFPERQPSIGNFVARECDLIIEPPQNTIPKMARIGLFVFVSDGVNNSSPIQKGVFFIDTREYTKNKDKMIIHGYDAALKFESDYDSSNLSWPAYPLDIVREIASSVGVTLDDRTTAYMSQFIHYKIPLQTNITKRDMLKGIAAQYCGNWTITDEGKLLLVGLNTGSDDVHLNYLVDENGNRLAYGGDRIIVGY